MKKATAARVDAGLTENEATFYLLRAQVARVADLT